MPLSKNLRKERSQAIDLNTITFNAPGVYYPPYGKAAFQIDGRGSPGNPSSYYTAPAPPNANYNPVTPGTNGTTVGARQQTYVYYTKDVYQPPAVYYDQYNTFPVSWNDPYTKVGWAAPDPISGYNQQFDAPFNRFRVTESVFTYSEVGDYVNAAIPGNIVSYNTEYQNVLLPGNSSPATNILGITFPGGNGDSQAPVIGRATVPVDYTNAGTPISVPPGGYVKIYISPR